MTEGPFGGPRPLSKNYLSINMEFIGYPEGLDVGVHPELAEEVAQELYRQSEEDDPLPGIEHVRVYDVPIPVGSHLSDQGTSEGFEVEVEFTKNRGDEDEDRLTLEQVKMIEQIFTDMMQNEHHKTYIISV